MLKGLDDLLFRIVRRICEDAGIKTTIDPIKAFYDYTMLPRLNEFIINKDLDLGMETLLTTMREEGFSWTLSTDALGCKIGKLIR